ncbi:glycosyltransferase family 2 protein [Roseobacteraceae bacterium S113]
MSSDTNQDPTYPGGITGLLAQMEGRLDPFTFAPDESLPPLDCDLDELASARVPSREEDPLRAFRPQSSNHRKFLDLRVELAGKSELAVLHGLLIAHLRKRSQPSHVPALFHRLWAEQSEHLLGELNPRWQVSAITTFGDHGRTPRQQQLGSALSVLFNTMKLYESERRYSGHMADKPFPLDRRRHTPLPLEMDAFSISSGGLDVNMIGRLWKEAEDDPVIQPLAHHLLDQLIRDPYTIFRRLRTMRARMERKKALSIPEPANAPEDTTEPDLAPVNIAPVGFVPPRRTGALRWGVVCTTNAPTEQVLAWAAHYIEMGADRLHIYLDEPNSDAQTRLAAHTKITTTTCDASFWKGAGKARPQAHQLRQAHNATHALHSTDVHLLGHIDVDEFLISPVPVAKALDFVPPDMAFARVRPVELLSPLDGPPRHFKRSHRQAGMPKSILEDIYPNFGPYLAGGFISHTTGKVFARTGIKDTRLGIHTLKYKGEEATNRTELPRMALAHCHTSDFAHFRARTAFRLERGSYRKAETKEDMALADVLTYLLREEGDKGLEAFYAEVCTARPELLSALEDKGMLLTHPLDLEDKVSRVFGTAGRARAGAA